MVVGIGPGAQPRVDFATSRQPALDAATQDWVPLLSCLRIGSLAIELDCPQQCLRARLERLFRTRTESAQRAGELRLSLRESAQGLFSSSDRLEMLPENDSLLISSDVISGRLWSGVPARCELLVHPNARDRPELDHYLLVILGSLLRFFGGLRLHAASLLWRNQGHLFVGPKGAGKTTLSLSLGRAGATVLAEDQTLVRRRADGSFWISGGDGRMRLTEPTERHFLGNLANVAPQDFAGTPKKEIDLQRAVPAQPFVDHPLTRIYFPCVQQAVSLEPLPGRTVLQRLLADLLPVHRFSSEQDRLGFFDFMVGLVQSVRGYRLALSPNLDDLSQLEHLLA